MSGGTAADTALSKVNVAFNAMPVTTWPAIDAFDSVLAGAGATLPLRDTLDARIVLDVINRTGRLIDVQGGFPHGTSYGATVSAWPALAAGTAPVDSDHDGMPDSWETANGSDPANPADRQAIASNGYTRLENYLNDIATGVVPTSVGGWSPAALRISPNPATAMLQLEFPALRSGACAFVFDMKGRLVRSILLPQAQTHYQLDISGLLPGVYGLKVHNGEHHWNTVFSKL
jgi:hypothetical protein